MKKARTKKPLLLNNAFKLLKDQKTTTKIVVV